MTIKTMLVGASGGSANDGATELACRLARRFEAHLEGLHVRPNPQDMILAAGAGFGMPLPGEWIDQVNAEAAETATKTKAAFAAAVGRHGLAMVEAPRSGATASWREETGYAAETMARRARFHDLIVLGRSERVVDRPSTDTIEETLIHSGRPVLIAPAKPPATLGTTIAIGWNGSPEAVRVVVAARPLLAVANSVFIVVVGEKHEASGASLQEYLAWHGIKSVLRHHPMVSGAGAGGQVLSAARDEGADMLVMGGYGRTPWRELLLGGATREIVGVSLLPLLMSH